MPRPGTARACMLAMVALLAAAALAMRWDSPLRERTGCARVQDMAGMLYTVDPCTGGAAPLAGPWGRAETETDRDDRPGNRDEL